MLKQRLYVKIKKNTLQSRLGKDVADPDCDGTMPLSGDSKANYSSFTQKTEPERNGAKTCKGFKSELMTHLVGRRFVEASDLWPLPAAKCLPGSRRQLVPHHSHFREPLTRLRTTS